MRPDYIVLCLQIHAPVQHCAVHSIAHSVSGEKRSQNKIGFLTSILSSVVAMDAVARYALPVRGHADHKYCCTFDGMHAGEQDFGSNTATRFPDGAHSTDLNGSSHDRRHSVSDDDHLMSPPPVMVRRFPGWHP